MQWQRFIDRFRFSSWYKVACGHTLRRVTWFKPLRLGVRIVNPYGRTADEILGDNIRCPELQTADPVDHRRLVSDSAVNLSSNVRSLFFC